MRSLFDSQVFERAQELVDRRRLLLGLCAAVAVALIAAIPGVLTNSGTGRRVRTTESAQAGTPTTLVGEGAVTAEPGGLMPLVPLPTTTTVPAVVLGTSFTQAPTTTTPKAGAKAAPPRPDTATTTRSAAPSCHNSYDPACGPFRWEPAPSQNQPAQMTVTASPGQPTVGQPVSFDDVITDPDDSQPAYSDHQWDFGDGKSAALHADPDPRTNPCPTRYGPWTPPKAEPGRIDENLGAVDQHTYTAPGTYTVTVHAESGKCYDPYASDVVGTVSVTVLP